MNLEESTIRGSDMNSVINKIDVSSLNPKDNQSLESQEKDKINVTDYEAIQNPIFIQENNSFGGKKRNNIKLATKTFLSNKRKQGSTNKKSNNQRSSSPQKKSFSKKPKPDASPSAQDMQSGEDSLRMGVTIQNKFGSFSNKPVQNKDMLRVINSSESDDRPLGDLMSDFLPQIKNESDEEVY